MRDMPDMVTEALALLGAEGYSEDFNLPGRSMVCPRCQTSRTLDRGVIERQFRFEGDSDPGDEAIVLGIRCPSCGTRGVLVSAYGHAADPDLFTHLQP